jgi:hypothetical protein
MTKKEVKSPLGVGVLEKEGGRGMITRAEEKARLPWIKMNKPGALLLLSTVSEACSLRAVGDYTSSKVTNLEIRASMKEFLRQGRQGI